MQRLQPTTYSLSPSHGFTLIEIAVIMAIIGIMTLLAAFAFPAVRTNQALLQAQQTFQTELRSAQQQALNELRAEECVATNAGQEVRCSNIGVALSDQTLTVFADTSGSDHQHTSEDYQLKEIELPATVSASQTFIFEASPPNIFLFANGSVVPPQGAAEFSFRSNDQVRNLKVRAYGQIETSNE